MIRALLSAALALFTLASFAASDRWEFHSRDNGNHGVAYINLPNSANGIAYACHGANDFCTLDIVLDDLCSVDNARPLLVRVDDGITRPVPGAFCSEGDDSSLLTVNLSGENSEAFVRELESGGVLRVAIPMLQDSYFTVFEVPLTGSREAMRRARKMARESKASNPRGPSTAPAATTEI